MNNININNINNIFNQLGREFTEIPQNMESVKLIVPLEELNKNPIVDFQSLDDDLKTKNEMCTICQYHFENDDKVRHLSWCCHIFHHNCIDSWLLEKSHKCPNCKKESPVYKPLI